MVKIGTPSKSHKTPLKYPLKWPYSGIDTNPLKFVHIHPPDKTPSPYKYYGGPIFMDPYFIKKQAYSRRAVHPLKYP